MYETTTMRYAGAKIVKKVHKVLLGILADARVKKGDEKKKNTWDPIEILYNILVSEGLQGTHLF